MLVHQRNNDVIQNIDMDALQAEVAGVIAKYVNIARHANANVGLKQEGDLDVLEMHFPLDQNSLGTAGGQKKMTVGKYADANNWSFWFYSISICCLILVSSNVCMSK